MEIQDIITLMKAISENGLTSFKMEEGNLKLSIKKEKEVQQIVTVAGGCSGIGGTLATASTSTSALTLAPTPTTSSTSTSASTQGSPSSAEEAQHNTFTQQIEQPIDSDKVIASPLVGTFYTSVSPEAEEFVKVGDSVKKGQTLGIIEAMKLMNEIECEYDGVVEAVLVSNEAVVEYGQPLFRIR